MLNLNKQELDELSEKSEMVNNFKKEVIKANNDEFIVDWISKEEEQKQYEEVMYEKGLNQGLSKGIEQNKIDVAKKMLELNMDLDIINKITNLGIEQLESLKK